MDTTLTVERITHHLDSVFGGLIDMSDVATKRPEDQRMQFLSRALALAAFCIRALTDADPKQAANAVTDLTIAELMQST